MNGPPRAVALSSAIPTDYFDSGRIPDMSVMFPPVGPRPEPEAVKTIRRSGLNLGFIRATPEFSWPWDYWKEWMSG